MRDGFIAAYLEQDAATRPRLRIYDVAAESVAGAYNQAVADGAGFVVGPLTKEDVAAVVPLSAGRIPVLALNFLGDTVSTPRNFYQFALSPEDEARNVARRAVADGRLNGVAIVPANEWGNRVAAAFADELSHHGGSVLDSQRYETAQVDFTDIIKQVMQLHVVKGEPVTHRTDAAFIFVAAGSAGVARQILPQLKFHYAGDVPVYSTSDSFEPDATANSDVDGMLFPDMPWMVADDSVTSQIRDSVRAAWPARAARRDRLYAFGFDAYRLVPMLRSKTAGEGSQISGVTGKLRLDGLQSHSPRPGLGADQEWSAERPVIADNNNTRDRMKIGKSLLLACLMFASDHAVAARSDWRQMTVGHFHLYSTMRDSKTRDVARQLQAFEKTVGELLRSQDRLPDVPTIIYILDYDDFLKFGAGRPGLAGVFYERPYANVITINGDLPFDNVKVTVFHEYTHFVQRNSSTSKMPPWFVEGYAELFSAFKLKGDKVTLGQVPDGVRMYLDRWIPMERLLAVKHTDPEYRAERLAPQFYGESWALVHLLLFDNKSLGQPDQQLPVPAGHRSAGARGLREVIPLRQERPRSGVAQADQGSDHPRHNHDLCGRQCRSTTRRFPR